MTSSRELRELLALSGINGRIHQSVAEFEHVGWVVS
jgi:hypothetical protein